MVRDDPPRDRSSTSTSIATNRRTVLKGAGTAIVGAPGLAGAVTADGSPVETIEMERRTWYGDWTADGSLPVADELFLFVHGFIGDRDPAAQAADVLESLRDGGYDPDAAVALEWPISTFDYDDRTEATGDVLADLVGEFVGDGGGDVRLVGHSVGCRCVLWATTELRPYYEIGTIALLGAAADGSAVCGDPWNEGLDAACEVRNYHSEWDTTVGNAFGGPEDTALGAEGVDCDPSDNYVDVDVSDSVDGHVDFLGDDTVGSDLADAIESSTCDGDSDPWDWF